MLDVRVEEYSQVIHIFLILLYYISRHKGNKNIVRGYLISPPSLVEARYPKVMNKEMSFVFCDHLAVDMS